MTRRSKSSRAKILASKLKREATETVVGLQNQISAKDREIARLQRESEASSDIVSLFRVRVNREYPRGDLCVAQVAFHPREFVWGYRGGGGTRLDNMSEMLRIVSDQLSRKVVREIENAFAGGAIGENRRLY